MEKTQLPVRYDPYDMGHAYVTIKGEPVECISEHYAAFKGRSEHELQIAAEELRRRNAHHSQQFTVTAAKLAEFITSVEAQEVLLAQRRRDYEARDVFTLMEGTVREQGEGGQVTDEIKPSARTSLAETSNTDDDIYEDF